MPKKTFYNLSENKRALIEAVLKDEFSKKPLEECNVKNIVERLSIARGSFYQYFEDLKDCYFYILDKSTVDIHLLFMTILKKHDYDLRKSFDEFGRSVSELIFSPDEYNIYKFRYLFFNSDLNDCWQARKNEFYNFFDCDEEMINFIKAVIHSLIERNFKEAWSKEEFLNKYKIHVNWLMKGVENENIWEFVWHLLFVARTFFGR